MRRYIGLILISVVAFLLLASSASSSSSTTVRGSFTVEGGPGSDSPMKVSAVSNSSGVSGTLIVNSGTLVATPGQITNITCMQVFSNDPGHGAFSIGGNVVNGPYTGLAITYYFTDGFSFGGKTIPVLHYSTLPSGPADCNGTPGAIPDYIISGNLVVPKVINFHG